MAQSSLPKFRWLIAGALAAGIWVVVDDMHAPRPPARVGQKAVAPKPRADVQKQARVKTAAGEPAALAALPEAAAAPPPRPSKMITGAIPKADAPARLLLRTTSKVRVRSRAATEGKVLAQLEAGRTAREMARMGKWRLVDADGTVGWVHADYLVVAKTDPMRPKVSVAGPKRVSSAEKPKAARAD